MATIVMTSQQVIDAATKVIAHIENTRKAKDEDSIARMMGTRKGWFKRFYPSREMAIKILDATSGTFGWRSFSGWGDMDHAKKLLLLARHGDPVTINEEDIRVLF